MGGVAVARVPLERAFRSAAGFFVAEQFVVGEGNLGEEPPVIAVGGGQRFEDGELLVVAVDAAAEADEAVHAARLGEREGVTREIGEVCFEERE